MKKGKGIKRLIKATQYSLQGLKTAFCSEVAFRQEVIALVIACAVVFYIDFAIYERILLIGSVVLVMIIELINSAIECVVDRISLEHHELSGKAKDYGSAAVFLAGLLAFALWIYLFYRHYIAL